MQASSRHNYISFLSLKKLVKKEENYKSLKIFKIKNAFKMKKKRFFQIFQGLYFGEV